MSSKPDPARIKAQLAELNPEAILFDGLDPALVGLAAQQYQKPRAVYSQALIIESILAEGLDHEGAWEWFSFNVQGLWAGEQTPLILLDAEAL